MKNFLRTNVELTIQRAIFSRLRRASFCGFIVPLNASELDTGHVLAPLEVQVLGLASAFFATTRIVE